MPISFSSNNYVFSFDYIKLVYRKNMFEHMMARVLSSP